MGHQRDQRIALETQFSTVWNNTTIVLFENAKTTPPEKDPYVTFTILTGEGEFASLGNPPRRRYQGVILVSVYVPEGSGSKRADELVELAESAFFDSTSGVGRQLSSGANGLITFSKPPTREVSGNVGGFYRVIVSFGFYRDQQGA